MSRITAVPNSATPPYTRVWRPVVMGAMAYALLYTVLCLWLLVTWRPDSFHGQVLGAQLFGLSLYHLLTAINVTWIAFLALDMRAALGSPRPMRRAHSVGVFLSIVVVLAIQLATLAMHDAALAWAPN